MNLKNKKSYWVKIVLFDLIGPKAFWILTSLVSIQDKSTKTSHMQAEHH